MDHSLRNQRTTACVPKWEVYIDTSDCTTANVFDNSAICQPVHRDENSDILSVSGGQRSVLNGYLSKSHPEQNPVHVFQFLEELDQQAAKVFEQFDDLERVGELYWRLTHWNRWLLRGGVEEKQGKLRGKEQFTWQARNDENENK
jgi:hypothetical protein